MKTLALPPGPRFASALDPVTSVVILLTMIGHAPDLPDDSLCSTCLCWWELYGWCFVSGIVQSKCNSSKDGFLLVDVELGVVCVFLWYFSQFANAFMKKVTMTLHISTKKYREGG